MLSTIEGPECFKTLCWASLLRAASFRRLFFVQTSFVCELLLEVLVDLDEELPAAFFVVLFEEHQRPSCSIRQEEGVISLLHT